MGKARQSLRISIVVAVCLVGASCTGNPSPDRYPDLAGDVVNVELDIPTAQMPGGVYRPAAERIDARTVRIHYHVGSCSTVANAQLFPTALSGSVTDGVLEIRVDTNLDCRGNVDDFAVDRSALLTIDSAEPWTTVTAIRDPG